MSQLKMHTINNCQSNIQSLAKLFPSCVFESIGKDGTVKTQVDLERLALELGLTDEALSLSERYELSWPGKRQALINAFSPIKATLRPDLERSVNFEHSKNIFIEGDNLDVLKCLQHSYLNSVDVILIDPPYNTGKDFVYKDNYRQSAQEHLEEQGLYDLNDGTLDSSLATDGRFHSQWLSMMYPRLKIARSLLSEQGVIFIFIDYHELDNLNLIAREIFGDSNYVGTLVIKTATDNNKSKIVMEHEYVLCFARNKDALNNWEIPDAKASVLINYYKELVAQGLSLAEIQIKLPVFIKEHASEIKGIEHYNKVDKQGIYSSNSNSSNTSKGNYNYAILHPITKQPCPVPENGWRWPEETFKAYVAADNVHWGEDHSTQPHIKLRLDGHMEKLKSVIYDDGRASTKLLQDQLNTGKDKVFDNPKSVELIKKILHFAAPKKDALIMDFFAGSGSTANAVLELNEKEGFSLNYLLVQIDEIIDESSAAFKHGFKCISDIALARLNALHDYYQKQNLTLDRAANNFNLSGGGIKTISLIDSGYRVFRLDSSNMNDVFYSPKEQQQYDFLQQITNIKPDRNEYDLLFQVLLEVHGLRLDIDISELSLMGHKVFNVAQGFLLACFSDEVDLELVKAMAQYSSSYLVLKNTSILDDSLLSNIKQYIKGVSNCQLLVL